MSRATRFARPSVSSSDSTAMRPEMTCSPPENRRIDASSAARTEVRPDWTALSSSFTSAVNGNGRTLRAWSFAAQIAVLHVHRHPRQSSQPARQFLGDRDGAVLAACAPYRDRDVALV